MRLLYTIYLLNILFGDYGGGYAGSAFRYGSNAREFSLAGAVIADKTPGFYSFSNPDISLGKNASPIEYGRGADNHRINRPHLLRPC